MASKKSKRAPQAKPASNPPPPPTKGPQVKDLMSRSLATCRPSDSLAVAAQIMWEKDCGVVPVTEADGRLVGVLTDRDACMAAYTQGKTLHSIPVESAMASRVVTLHGTDPVAQAHELMRSHRLRRLPVVDDEHRLVGLISLKDLALDAAESARSQERQQLALTLACISRRGVEETM